MGAATAALGSLGRCRRRRRGSSPSSSPTGDDDEDEAPPIGYEGQVHEGLRHGFGKLRLASGAQYEGQWDCSSIRGEGTWIYSGDGGRYTGQWLHSKMHGKGKFYSGNGATYDGQWFEGMFHLKGDLESQSGTVYSGQWNYGREHGRGKLTFTDGKIYDGQWVKGEVRGRGTLTYPDQRKQYIGQFRQCRPDGFGQLTYADGSVYEGQWERGVPCGRGRWREADGEWVVEGSPDPLVTPLSSVRASLSGRQAMPGRFVRSSSKGTMRSGTSGGDSSLAMSVGIIQRFNDSDREAVSYLRECVSEPVLHQWFRPEEEETTPQPPSPVSPVSSTGAKSTESAKRKWELRPVEPEESDGIVWREASRSLSIIDSSRYSQRSSREDTSQRGSLSRSSSKEAKALSSSGSEKPSETSSEKASQKETGSPKDRKSKVQKEHKDDAESQPLAATADAPLKRSTTKGDTAPATTIGKTQPAPREMTNTSWGESAAPSREPTGHLAPAPEQMSMDAARNEKFQALDAKLGADSSEDVGLPRSGQPAALRPIPSAGSDEKARKSRKSKSG